MIWQVITIFFCVANAGFLYLDSRPIELAEWTSRYCVLLLDFRVLNIFEKSVPKHNELKMQLKHLLDGQVNPYYY